jgi:plasmid stabilization system protein ParE
MTKRKHPVLIYPAAEADLWEIVSYLRELSPTAAKNFLDSLGARLEELEAFSELHPQTKDKRLAEKGYRSFPIGNHIVFYTIAEDCVQIRRIIYGKRQFRELL